MVRSVCCPRRLYGRHKVNSISKCSGVRRISAKQADYPGKTRLERPISFQRQEPTLIVPGRWSCSNRSYPGFSHDGAIPGTSDRQLRSHLEIRPFPDEPDDDAVSAEWL